MASWSMRSHRRCRSRSGAEEKAMEKLFGLEMATIAGALSAILILVILSLALLA